MFKGGVPRTGNEVKTMNPIHSLIQVEWVPSQLVRDVVKLLGFSSHVGVVRVAILGHEILMSGRGEDPVHPSLSILMSRGGECGSRKLLGVKPIGCLLWRVLPYRESSLDSFGPEKSRLVGKIDRRCPSISKTHS